jgi:hypothetical protein
MVDESLILIVASYKGVSTALSDYRCLEGLESPANAPSLRRSPCLAVVPEGWS